MYKYHLPSSFIFQFNDRSTANARIYEYAGDGREKGTQNGDGVVKYTIYSRPQMYNVLYTSISRLIYVCAVHVYTICLYYKTSIFGAFAFVVSVWMNSCTYLNIYNIYLFIHSRDAEGIFHIYVLCAHPRCISTENVESCLCVFRSHPYTHTHTLH